MQRSNKRGKQGVGAQHDIGNKANVRSEIDRITQIRLYLSYLSLKIYNK